MWIKTVPQNFRLLHCTAHCDSTAVQCEIRKFRGTVFSGCIESTYTVTVDDDDDKYVSDDDDDDDDDEFYLQ